MRERTVASLSEIYFGYMKVYDKLTILTDFEVIMGYILFSTGYSLQDWKISINIIIAKKRKENMINNLQIINLMEVDFNFSNKILAKHIMECIERNNLLSKE